jgi:hypothetical protein
VVAGDSYTCTWRPQEPRLQCVGSNHAGQLSGTPTSTAFVEVLSVPLPGVSIQSVTAGTKHICAVVDLKEDAALVCQGAIPTGFQPPPPTQLRELLRGNIDSLISSAFSTCVLVGGELVCWGLDHADEQSTSRGPRVEARVIVLPEQASAPAPGRNFALGGRHLCLADPANGVRCIGLPGPRSCSYAGLSGEIVTPGQIENCYWSEVALSPEERGWLPVEGLPAGPVDRLLAGDEFACALIEDQLYCWGWNKFGGLGFDVLGMRPPAVFEVLRSGARAPATLQPVTLDPAQSCPGFYIGRVSLSRPADPASIGAWGMEILLREGRRQLHGGLNFGGFALDVIPGYAAFRIDTGQAQPQRVNLQLRGDGGDFELQVYSTVPPDPMRVLVHSETLQLGADEISRSIDLANGFHIVRLVPQDTQPHLFLVSARTTTLDGAPASFRHGAVVGGYLEAAQTGFAALCTDDAAALSLRTEARTERGPQGSGDLRLQLIDGRTREVLHDSDVEE